MDLNPSFLCDFTKSSQPLFPAGVPIVYSGGVNGTRFDENGLISAAVAPRIDYDPASQRINYLLFSDTLDPGTWSSANANNPVVRNTPDVAAPDGTYTACKWSLLDNSGNRAFGAVSALLGSTGRTDTFSFWVYIPSANSNNTLQAYMFCGTEIPVDPVNLNALPRNQWVRVSYTHTWVTAGLAATISCQPHGNFGNTVGDIMYIWHPQLEIGATPTAWLPSYASVGKSIPTPIGLLLEEARTNLCLQSEDLSTTWVPSGSTISTNAIAAPDGNTTADQLVESVGGTFHTVAQSITKAASALVYSVSVWAKAGARRYFQLQIDDAAANGAMVFFDLLSGVISSASTTVGSGWVAGTASIKAYPNGWYLCKLENFTTNTATTIRVNPALSNNGTNTNYSGDGASGNYFWGWQLEQAAEASSYIPTAAAAVTRTAEGPIVPCAQWYTPKEGSWYVEARAKSIGIEKGLFACSGGGLGTRAFIGAGLGTNFKDDVAPSQATCDNWADELTVGKFAAAYKEAVGIWGSYNGNAPVVNGVCGAQTPVNLRLGTNNSGGAVLNGWLRKIAFTQKAVDPSFCKQLSQR